MRITGPSVTHLQGQEDLFEELVMAGVRQALNVAAKDLKGTWTGDDLAVIERVFTAYTAEKLIPWLTGSYQEAVSSQHARLTEAVVTAAGFTIPPPATTLAEQYLATATNRLSGISDVVWQHTRDELQTGMQAGESIPQLRKRVQSVAEVSKARATMIARTEVIGAQNRGSLGQMVAADMPGRKNWLATRDSRTRPSHANANGQTAALTGTDTTFTVGGVSMDGPHDTTAPARETINCRCTLTYDLDDEAVQMAADRRWDQAFDFQKQAQEYADSKSNFSTRASKAWHSYQFSPYRDINKTLRGEDSKERRAMIKTWDQVFDRHGMDTTDDFLFYRGIKGGVEGLEIGKEFVEKAVMSTTASEVAARGWLTDFIDADSASPESAIVELRVPKGTRVVGGHVGTFETMLRPGTKIRVLAIEQRPSPGRFKRTDDVTYIVAEVIP